MVLNSNHWFTRDHRGNSWFIRDPAVTQAPRVNQTGSPVSVASILVDLRPGQDCSRQEELRRIAVVRAYGAFVNRRCVLVGSSFNDPEAERLD